MFVRIAVSSSRRKANASATQALSRSGTDTESRRVPSECAVTHW
ncbi:hypothetical protein SGRIM128S_07764 [Streptomyces griseomycini]